MKTYIGTKIINAEPMKYSDYYRIKGHNPLDLSLLDKDYKWQVDGYKVEYEDGYVSWYPKKEFEEAYREMNVNSMEELRKLAIAIKESSFVDLSVEVIEKLLYQGVKFGRNFYEEDRLRKFKENWNTQFSGISLKVGTISEEKVNKFKENWRKSLEEGVTLYPTAELKNFTPVHYYSINTEDGFHYYLDLQIEAEDTARSICNKIKEFVGNCQQENGRDREVKFKFIKL